MADLVGSWKFESTENFVGYLKACGLSEELIKEYSVLHPSEVWSVSGDTWNLLYKTEKKEYNISMKLGEEFKEYNRGYETTNMMKSDASNRICHDQKYEKEGKKVHAKYIRERKGDKLHMSMECNGAKATRIYTKA